MGGPPGRPGSGGTSVPANVRAAAFGAGGPASREDVTAAGASCAGSVGVEFLREGWRSRRPGPALDQLAGPGETLGVEEPSGEAGLVTVGEAAVDELVIIRRRGAAQGQCHGAETELEQAVAARGLGVVVALGRRGAQDLDLAPIEPEALVDGLGLRLQRTVVGQEDARGQLSITAGAMVERSMSASDCVANTTATFFLRRVLSHSRMRAANKASSRKVQASSRISRLGRPSKRASSRWNR